ncbi:MAG: hypothetical protein AB1502_03130 [Thermodesulfobacteriota bacterium]
MAGRRRPGRMRVPKPNRSSHSKSYRIVCAGCGTVLFRVFKKITPPWMRKNLFFGLTTLSD